MNPKNPFRSIPILIVANSGRMLAKSAKSVGYAPSVIDVCADADLRQYAIDNIRLPALNRTHLLSAVKVLKKRRVINGVVYGSGFEQFTDGLALLADNFTLLGNNAQVFSMLQDKAAFFVTLNRLNIPYPATQFHTPGQCSDWLFKPHRGCGGSGIVKVNKTALARSNGYWQKYQRGQPHSVLFLADGKSARIVGFNEQWTTAIAAQHFMFAGLVNAVQLGDTQKARLSLWVNKIVNVYGLVGLNSLDFIQDGDESYVLEINARPPASMQLYGDNLFIRHVRACQGELPDVSVEPVQNQVVGYQIVYASTDCTIPKTVIWPEGVMDLPEPGSQINTGQPICSIMAHGTSAQAVRGALNHKQDTIVNQLEGLNLWNIPSALTR